MLSKFSDKLFCFGSFHFRLLHEENVIDELLSVD